MKLTKHFDGEMSQSLHEINYLEKCDRHNTDLMENVRRLADDLKWYLAKMVVFGCFQLAKSDSQKDLMEDGSQLQVVIHF